MITQYFQTAVFRWCLACAAVAVAGVFVGYRAGRRVFVYHGDLVAWDRAHSGDPSRVLTEVPHTSTQQHSTQQHRGQPDARRADTIGSSFQCFGSNVEVNSSEYQTCEYRNLCYFHGKFHYVAVDEDDREHVSQNRLNVRSCSLVCSTVTRARTWPVAPRSRAAEMWLAQPPVERHRATCACDSNPDVLCRLFYLFFLCTLHIGTCCRILFFS